MAASHLGVKLCSMSFTILFCQAAFKRIRIFTATLRSKYIINLNPSKLITMMPAKTWATKSKFHCFHFFPLTYELTFFWGIEYAFISFFSLICLFLTPIHALRIFMVQCPLWHSDENGCARLQQWVKFEFTGIRVWLINVTIF